MRSRGADRPALGWSDSAPPQPIPHLLTQDFFILSPPPTQSRKQPQKRNCRCMLGQKIWINLLPTVAGPSYAFNKQPFLYTLSSAFNLTKIQFNTYSICNIQLSHTVIKTLSGGVQHRGPTGSLSHPASACASVSSCLGHCPHSGAVASTSEPAAPPLTATLRRPPPSTTS